MTVKEEQEESWEIMKYLADKFFDSKCAITFEECNGKGFSIHHLEEKDGDILHRPYKKKYGKYRYRIHYLRDLKKQFDNDPTLANRTILVQNFVHARYDHYKNGTNKFPMEQRVRFCKYALLTITPVGRRKKK